MDLTRVGILSVSGWNPRTRHNHRIESTWFQTVVSAQTFEEHYEQEMEHKELE